MFYIHCLPLPAQWHRIGNRQFSCWKHRKCIQRPEGCQHRKGVFYLKIVSWFLFWENSFIKVEWVHKTLLGLIFCYLHGNYTYARRLRCRATCYFLKESVLGILEFGVWGTLNVFFSFTKLLFLIGLLPYLCRFFVGLNSKIRMHRFVSKKESNSFTIVCF